MEYSVHRSDPIIEWCLLHDIQTKLLFIYQLRRVARGRWCPRHKMKSSGTASRRSAQPISKTPPKSLCSLSIKTLKRKLEGTGIDLSEHPTSISHRFSGNLRRSWRISLIWSNQYYYSVSRIVYNPLIFLYYIWIELLLFSW